MKSQNQSPCSFSPARLLARLLACALIALPLAAAGEPTELADMPLSGASSKEIKPNILFILDDSLSMEETFLPDWAGMISYRQTPSNKNSQVYSWYPSEYQSLNPGFNGVAYNPRIRYLPPSYFNAGGVIDGKKYPSQTRAATDGWKAVPLDGYGIQSADKVNLVGVTDDPASPTRAAYYDTVAGEYCKDESLRDCRSKKEGGYMVPASLRWCRTDADAVMATPTKEADAKPDCQAVFIDYSGAEDGGVSTYMYPRMPSPRIARISVTGSGETLIKSIKVDNKEILYVPVKEVSPQVLAAAIAKNIQECAYRKAGACGVVGYQASASGSDVFITAPDDLSGTVQPSVVKEGSMAVTSHDFGAGNASFVNYSDGKTLTKENKAAGYIRFIPITPATATYPKETSRTDCAGNVCTYEEEMTNYANWYAYYRTRMQAMKAAASRSFEPIDGKYRIGYFSINNNTGADFQNIVDFDGTHKGGWYEKLFAATPYRGSGTADTPLRKALSDAGWLFAGKYKTLYGVTVEDPIQYYCQTNAVILSTDGYWNMAAGVDLDNRAVGDRDGPSSGEARPILDGGVGTRTKRTEKWWKTIVPTEPTWYQKQEWQWVFDQNGFKVETKTKPTKEVASLQSRRSRQRQETWKLQKREYTNLWWVDHSQPNQWTKKAEWIKKTTKMMQKRELQTYLVSNSRVDYVDGVLYQVPRSLYTRSTRDLYKRERKVVQTNKGLGTETQVELDIGEECTIRLPNQTCAWKDWTPWEKVSQCTVVGGEKAPSGKGDDKYTKYVGERQCGYRYSSDVETVPDSAKEKDLPSCTAKSGSAAPNYTVPQEISCVKRSVGNSDRKETTSCEMTAEYTCQYAWETTRKEWTEAYACKTEESTGTSYGTQYVGPGRRCFVDQYTPPDYRPCDPSEYPKVADGVTTECRTKIISDWRNATCSASGPDAEGKRVECQWGTESVTNNASTCQWKNDASEVTTCEWVAQPDQINQTTPCSSTAKETDPSKVWTGPVETCTATGWKYVACNDTSNPAPGGACVYPGWTAFYETTASCKKVKQVAGVDTLGDTECKYVKTVNTILGTGVACAPSTPAVEPPAGADNPSTYPADNSDLQVTYTKCSLYDWTGYGNVATCNNNHVTEECKYSAYYSYDDPKEECPSQAKAESSGDGVWDVKEAVKCTKAFEFQAFMPTCPTTCTGESCETKCTAQKLENQPIDDASFDPKNLPSDGRTYRTQLIYDWYSFLPGSTSRTGNLPTATEEKPSPTNQSDEFCPGGEGTTVGATGYVDDKRWETVCRKVKLNSSARMATAACPGGKDANEEDRPNQTGNFPSVKDGQKFDLSCSVDKSATTNDNNCGKQPDGSFVAYIPADSANAYTHTYCGAGYGTPTPDTLADVAEYYFKTDLRTIGRNNCISGSSGEDVCLNTGTAKNGQVMYTYTLGLGASGVMRFQEDYAKYTDATQPYIPALALEGGDIYSITQGVTADPDNGVCAWQKAGTPCNWPRPGDNRQTNIDDLWHAAINGRGLYFSAQNPESMAAGISAALQNVTAKDGSLTAVTTTGPRLEADSALFQASFTSGAWTGEIRRLKLGQDANGKSVLTDDWSARSKLDNVPHVSRKVYFFDPAANILKTFEWDSLDSARKDYFRTPHIKGLTQLCVTEAICLPNQKDPGFKDDFAEKLVDFLRGDRSNEGELGNLAKYFRKRTNVLGDIVGSEATYVKKPPRNYTDNGYGKFKADNAERKAMLYVGANDGMLHAFYADTGEEAWAVIPSFILPELYRLADKAYIHSFFVDGTPVMGDICVGNCGPGEEGAVWKTLLVGGANKGGRGYYALDVTDPEAPPKVLWEFTDTNLGYSYGNPVITKLADGTWVVLVTSGYNNVSPGDGEGHLFVLDAQTGSKLKDISTGVGTGDTPSGLSKIAVFATYPEYNNTALRAYGGDLEGNLWRFDINDSIGKSGYDAQLLVHLTDDKNQPQPITAPPELGLVKNRPVVFVGTGRMLGPTDMGTRDTHSLYAILDRLTGETYGNPRTTSSFVKQVMTAGKDLLCPENNAYCPTGAPMVTVTNNSVDWATRSGWYVDFPGKGERVNTSMRLVSGTLAVVTNTPQQGACVPAGISFAYFLNYETGGYVGNVDGMAGYQLSDNLAASSVFIQNPDGSTDQYTQNDNTGGTDSVSREEVPIKAPEGKVRRISWRELTVE
jgi:hypothetical protein